MKLVSDNDRIASLVHGRMWSHSRGAQRTAVELVKDTAARCLELCEAQMRHGLGPASCIVAIRAEFGLPPGTDAKGGADG